MQDERKMILEMVAEEKISADEAAELLHALASTAPSQSTESPGKPRRGRRARRDGESRGRSILENFLNNLDVDWGSLPFAFGGEAYRFEERFEGEFAGEGPIILDLQARNGRIEVFGSEAKGWRAVLRKKVRAQDEAQAKQRAAEIAKFSSGPQTIRFTEETKGWNGSGVSLEIHVPQNLVYDVQARSSNGRVVIENLRATDLVGRTANGKVAAVAVAAGTADLTTANGNISFTGTAGDLECKTANGSIQFRLVPESNMRCRLRTTNGSIKVRTPADHGLGHKVKAQTGHGGLEVSLPDFEVKYEEKQFGRRRLEGQTRGYDDKGVKLEMTARATNGSIKVLSGEPSGERPPAPRNPADETGTAPEGI